MPPSVPRLHLFTQATLAAHVLECLKPALRALVADSVSRIPDYTPVDEARVQVLAALTHSVEHTVTHVPGLHLTRGLLIVAARQIVDRADANASVAALKSYAIDQMTIRVNSARV